MLTLAAVHRVDPLDPLVGGPDGEHQCAPPKGVEPDPPTTTTTAPPATTTTAAPSFTPPTTAANGGLVITPIDGGDPPTTASGGGDATPAATPAGADDAPAGSAAGAPADPASGDPADDASGPADGTGPGGEPEDAIAPFGETALAEGGGVRPAGTITPAAPFTSRLWAALPIGLVVGLALVGVALGAVRIGRLGTTP